MVVCDMSSSLLTSLASVAATCLVAASGSLSAPRGSPAPFMAPRASSIGRRQLLTGAAASGLLLPVASYAYDDATFKSVATQVGGSDYVDAGGGLKYKDIREGAGDKVREGDTVAIQFSGRCLNLNGKKFISTQDPAVLSTGLQIS